MQQIQFIQTTPEQLTNEIAEAVKRELANLAQPTEPQQLLTREQTAHLLHIDLSTLWQWTKRGKLKSYGIGNRVYYKRTEIDEALTTLNG